MLLFCKKRNLTESSLSADPWWADQHNNKWNLAQTTACQQMEWGQSTSFLISRLPMTDVFLDQKRRTCQKKQFDREKKGGRRVLTMFKRQKNALGSKLYSPYVMQHKNSSTAQPIYLCRHFPFRVPLFWVFGNCHNLSLIFPPPSV